MIYVHDSKGNSLELRFGPKGMTVIHHDKDGHAAEWTATPDTSKLFIYDVNTKGAAALREHGKGWTLPWTIPAEDTKALPPTSPESPS